MQARAALAAGLLLTAGASSAAPRVVVWLPRDGAGMEPDVRRAFAWPSALTVLRADTVSQRFPPSPRSREQAESEDQLEKVARAAELHFAALRLEDAARTAAEAARVLERLPPSVRRERIFARLHLLEGRVELARKNPRGFAAAVALAAEAAAEVELDEAEYPPQVRQAFLAARALERSRPARSLRIESAPAGAEIEVNGRLAGRTPAVAQIPPGRCFLSIARTGHRPRVAECPAGESFEIALEPAESDDLRDQLRERLSTDPSWYLEPLLLEALASEEGALWIAVLERDLGGGLKVLVYSAAERALRPIDPSRFAEGEIDQLAAAVGELVAAARRLDARAIETPTGVPALEVRSDDPELASAAAFVRRPGDARYDRLTLAAQSAGQYQALLPLALAADGRWELEFWAQGYDRGGTPTGSAGSATSPLRYRREPIAGGTAAAAPAWYSRWYVWTAIGVVAAGAAATGTYFALKQGEVSLTFGTKR